MKCRSPFGLRLFRVSKKWLNATFLSVTGFASRIRSRAAKSAKYENLWVFIRSAAHVVSCLLYTSFPVYECPECGVEQLAYDADTHRYHCFACDENFTDGDLEFCARCGSLMRRNGEPSICDNCIEDMMRDRCV